MGEALLFSQEDIDGKKLVADAVTDMGVDTSVSDSFETIADNIKKIETPFQESIVSETFLNTTTKVLPYQTYNVSPGNSKTLSNSIIISDIPTGTNTITITSSLCSTAGNKFSASLTINNIFNTSSLTFTSQSNGTTLLNSSSSNGWEWNSTLSASYNVSTHSLTITGLYQIIARKYYTQQSNSSGYCYIDLNKIALTHFK